MMAALSDDVRSSFFIRHSGSAANWYNRLGHWLLGDFGGKRPEPEKDWNQVFKTILGSLRWCMRSTKEAMRKDWHSTTSDDFTKLG